MISQRMMQAVVTLAFTTHVLTLAHANAEELKFRVVPQQVKLNGHFEQSQLVVNQVLGRIVTVSKTRDHKLAIWYYLKVIYGILIIIDQLKVDGHTSILQIREIR